ncbi:MAG: GntR family transcriptional regulator [Intrasporangiaceae bacterium]|nr:GntR family transcriptional regulator [Intrasporangiaceae bacterium]
MPRRPVPNVTTIDRTVLDPSAPTPLHVQISDWLRGKIDSGAWPEHFRLPPEPSLAAELGVSRGTLRRAIGALVADGLLTQTPGRGTFVTGTIVESQLAQRLTTLNETFLDAGQPLTTQVIAVEKVTLSAPLVALLETTPQVEVLRLERVRHLDGVPVARLINLVRLDVAPGLEKVDFATRPLFEALEHDYDLDIASARRSFDAVLAGTDNAELLEVDPGAPLLHLEQLTRAADGTPIEYSDVWLRADRLRVTSLLTRH